MIHKSFKYLFTFAIVLQACVKDKPVGPQKTNLEISSGNTVFVINEGNYGWNNAGISLYDPASNQIATDYYRQQNNNQALGDVCQSMIRYNSNYYIVVNNSHKIIVAGGADLKKTATISGFNSPRYMLPVTNNKAYVSDLYANSIQVVNLNTNAITGSIPCSGWTEQMAMIYNKAFVTNINTAYTYVINTITDQITDSIMVGKGAGSLVFDRNDKLWILSGGSTSNSVAGKLLRIDPVSLQVELSIPFAAGDSPGHLCINRTKDTLYYLNSGVYRMPVQSTQLPGAAFVTQGTKTFYGLGVNPNDYRIYVSDAIDYTQSSKITVYKPDGSPQDSISAGLLSNGFLFE